MKADAPESQKSIRESINAGRLLHLLMVLLVVHPLSMGPVQYASGCGWIAPGGWAQDFFVELYLPETWLLDLTPPRFLVPARRGFVVYLLRAYQLGRAQSD